MAWQDLNTKPVSGIGTPIKSKFYDMCEALNRLGIWVFALHLSYPHVDAVAGAWWWRQATAYLDIPFQHASPNVLKAMKTPAHSENVLERIKTWRSICPDIVIRSTFRGGFPGKKIWNICLTGFKRRLDRVGAFTIQKWRGGKRFAKPCAKTVSNNNNANERLMALQQ